MSGGGGKREKSQAFLRFADRGGGEGRRVSSKEDLVNFSLDARNPEAERGEREGPDALLFSKRGRETTGGPASSFGLQLFWPAGGERGVAFRLSLQRKRGRGGRSVQRAFFRSRSVKKKRRKKGKSTFLFSTPAV